MCNSNKPMSSHSSFTGNRTISPQNPRPSSRPSFTDLEGTLHRQNLAFETFETSKKRIHPSARSGNQSACFSDKKAIENTESFERLNQEELKILKYDQLWDGGHLRDFMRQSLEWGQWMTMASKAFKNHSLKSSQLPKIIRTKIEENHENHSWKTHPYLSFKTTKKPLFGLKLSTTSTGRRRLSLQ